MNRCFESIADWHTVIHEDQRVGVLMPLPSLLHQVECFAPIERRIAIIAILVEDALGGDRTERVIIDEKNAC